MLKFQWRPTVSDAPTDTLPSLASEHPDLAIRNLLDDPRLRRAMGLDDAASAPPVPPAVPVVPVVPPGPAVLTVTAVAPTRPEPVFNRRRLLERDAA